VRPTFPVAHARSLPHVSPLYGPWRFSQSRKLMKRPLSVVDAIASRTDN
jgi:hypothetical protein